MFFHLEVWNAVSQDAAYFFVLLKDHDIVACSRKLLRRRQTCRTRADNRNSFAGLCCRGQWLYPALGESFFDYLKLNVPDKHRLVVYRQCAGCLAGCRTDPAGDFGKVVCRMKLFTGVAPVSLINQFIDVGYRIFQGAAHPVAERYPAVHTSGRLLHDLVRSQRKFELVEIVYAFFNRPIADRLTPVF